MLVKNFVHRPVDNFIGSPQRDPFNITAFCTTAKSFAPSGSNLGVSYNMKVLLYMGSSRHRLSLQIRTDAGIVRGTPGQRFCRNGILY